MASSQVKKDKDQIRIMQFVEQQVCKYKFYMDEDERLSEGWQAFLSACNSYSQYEGCCEFETYATFRIQEHFDALRKKNNSELALFSPLSLNQKFPDGNEIGTYFLKCSGDFTKGIDLWDFIGRLPENERFVVRGLYYKNDPEEIMKAGRFSQKKYCQTIMSLQESFSHWLAL